MGPRRRDNACSSGTLEDALLGAAAECAIACGTLQSAEGRVESGGFR